MTTGTHGYVPVTLTMLGAAAMEGAGNHALAALGYVCGLPMAWSSMLPDMIGIWGGSLAGRWDQYVRAHHGDIGAVRACMSPWYKFHLKTDLLTHHDGKMKPPPLGKTWQKILLEVAVLGACAGGLAHVYCWWVAILSFVGVWLIPALCVGVSYLYSPYYDHPA